jgi:hypothetical protein
LESRAKRTYDRDFESIKNPRYPEPDDDEEVKTAPRQPIEPKRNIGVNDGGIGASKVWINGADRQRGPLCRLQRHDVFPARVFHSIEVLI